MTLPRTPKGGKKNSKKGTPKKEVKEEENGDAKKEEVTPVRKQLEEQRRREKVREMEEQLNALVRQREAVKNKLKRVKTATKTSAAEPNANLQNAHFLKQQLKSVDDCFKKFGEYQSKIYSLALTVDQRTQQERVELEFETMFDTLSIELNEHLEKLVKPEPTAAVVPASRANVVVPQYLPPLAVPLPKFDGQHENWKSFKSMFQSIMARYINEAPAIKLHHLRESLVGSAEGVIDQDIVNNNDYDAAWAILEEEYGDKRIIVDKHIDKVFALPYITNDNAVELRKLIDTCVKHVEGLKNLQLPVDGLGEQMIVNLLASRMDRETRKAWEAEQKVGVLPSYAATITFLKNKSRVLERTKSSRVSAVSEKSTRSVALVIASNARCSICNQRHELNTCERFKQQTVNERFSHLRKCGLCFSCFRKGHRAAVCSSTITCQVCSKRHHTLLHTNRAEKQEMTPESTTAESPKLSTKARTQLDKKHTLLPTAVVLVHGRDGVPRKCRALIDSCSQNHFITEKCANRLDLRKERADCGVSGLNGGVTRISHLVRTKIKSRVSLFSAEVELLVTPRIIEDMPPEAVDIANWNMPAEMELADPEFYSRGNIDMILGAEVFWDLIKEGKLELGVNLPSLRDTELGWVVGGALSSRTSAAVRSFCGVIRQGAKDVDRAGRRLRVSVCSAM